LADEGFDIFEISRMRMPDRLHHHIDLDSLTGFTTTSTLTPLMRPRVTIRDFISYPLDKPRVFSPARIFFRSTPKSTKAPKIMSPLIPE